MEQQFSPDSGSSPLDCDSVRLAVSAAADGEPGWSDQHEDHLAGCADCVAYRDRVASLARSTRVRAVSTDAAFVESVMQRSQPARLGPHGWLRPALAWCGALVAFQSFAPLVLGEIDGAPSHVARHVGASTIALAVGLLYVAWRPHRAAGLLPFVTALFVAMLAGAVFDVASGDRSMLSESVHLSELVGLILVWVIAGSPGWDRVTGLLNRAGAATSTT